MIQCKKSIDKHILWDKAERSGCVSWDFKADRPIYTQLLEMIQTRIMNETYPLGSKLPSVRELAAEASVNPNTMQKALMELEQRGFVFSQRTSGRFVTEDEQLIAQAKEKLAQEYIREFMSRMEQIGYDESAVKKLLQ